MKTTVIRLLAGILIVTGGVIFVVSSRKQVTIRWGEQTTVFSTFARTVDQVVAEADLVLGSADRIQPPLDSPVLDEMIIRVEFGHPIQVWDGENVEVVYTQARRPVDILTEAGIQLFPGDQILFAAGPIEWDDPLDLEKPVVLQVIRAKTVTLQILEEPYNEGNIQEQNLISSAATLGEALAEAGILIRAGDELDPPASTVLDGPLKAVLKRGRFIQVESSGEKYSVYVVADSVGTALAKAGYALQYLDYSDPPEGQPIPKNGQIRIIRVREEFFQEEELIPFNTVTQPAPDLDLDTRQVIQTGQFGVKINQIRIRYEDDIEVSRQAAEEWVAVEPKPRIVGYGTKIVVRTVSTPAGSVEYWRVVDAYATSYSPCRLGRPDFCNDRTASGILLKKGVVGVIRSWYNAMVGTNVYVPGYGTAVIADIGGGVAGRNWIDLGYSDNDFVSWSSNVKIYFLTPIPPVDQILWILP